MHELFMPVIGLQQGSRLDFDDIHSFLRRPCQSIAIGTESNALHVAVSRTGWNRGDFRAIADGPDFNERIPSRSDPRAIGAEINAVRMSQTQRFRSNYSTARLKQLHARG